MSPTSGHIECRAGLSFRSEYPAGWELCAPDQNTKDGSFKRKDIELEFCGSFFGLDTYLPQYRFADSAAARETGFFYEFLFFREKEILWSDTQQRGFKACVLQQNRFRLICYRDDFKTPEWLGSKIIYHIYVDRFRRGAEEISLRPGTVIDEDWESGVPHVRASRWRRG